jgi:hyperosmotically inducible periplasmic protein
LKTKTLLFGIPILSVLVSCGTQTGRVEPSRSTATNADNTARNERDRSSASTTATDQAENKQDLEIAANIRKAIIADNSLSTNAHNVKIIASNGVVTLRGPVKSEQEKSSVEAKAKGVAGVQQVNNMLEVEAGP